ncbi:MAG TPA: hypothetical protein VLJ21_05385 [Candidatus Binatia bacterium]|nr:hypothetical protein [Candidatus Binatia bacterium]
MEDTTVTSQKEVALTYEKLYELLRREKNREELQALDVQFYTQLVVYLGEKDRTYSDTGTKNDLFSISERDRLHSELQNIRRLVKDLYERREKKVLDMALNRSRTNANIVDTTNLLPAERALFDQLVSTLDLFRHGIYGNVIALREPQLSPGFTSASSFTPAPSHPAPSVPGSLESSPAKSHRTLRFLQQVPQVVDAHLEPYGPFAINDTALIPSEIADIWIEQGAAVEVLP